MKYAGIIALFFLFLLFIPTSYAISFDYTPANPSTSTSIQFTTNISGIEAISYVWDFGDGNHSSSESPFHRYADDGNYTVILSVIDSSSNVYQCNQTIHVNNTPPVADFEWDIKKPNPLDSIRFTDRSHDKDGRIVEWQWEINNYPKIHSRNITHAFIKTGIYNVTLTVWDDDGDNSSLAKGIIIAENKAPDAVFTIQSNVVRVGEQIAFTDCSIDRDGEVVEWHWNFGDGTTSDERDPTHIYTENGNHTVILTVWDDDSAYSSYSMVVSVVGGDSNNDTPGFTVALFVAVMLIILSKKYLT